jgi:hypothetical protein
MTTFERGDPLVIRGHNMTIVTTDATYVRTDWCNGEAYVVYRTSEGILSSVDEWRAGHLKDAAISQFRERLAEALDVLGDIGANYCGDLNPRQAHRFHKAVGWLEKLALEATEVP